MCSTTNPVFDSLDVQANKLFIVAIWEWVIAAHLLQILAVPCSLVICGHYTEEGSVGTTTKSQSDSYVSSMIIFHKEMS